MDKKVIILCFLVLIMSVFVCAENTTDNNNSSKINLAFQCLQNKTRTACDEVKNIQDLSLVILSNPSNVQNCVSILEKNVSKNDKLITLRIRDVAMATLALKSQGKDVSDLKKWLINRTITPTNIHWFIQQYSDGETSCTIKGNETTSFTVGPTNKITLATSNCFNAYKSYWLEIEPSCYGKNFEINCESNYQISIMYTNKILTNKDAPDTFYILGESTSASAYNSLKFKVNSKCFPSKYGDTDCSYEDTLWAAYVLHELGEDITPLLSYLNALSTTSSNEAFLPEAFLVLLNTSSVYEDKLYNLQKSDGSWKAINSNYDEYYDTSLSLLALGLDTENTLLAENWLWYNQGTNGCWNNIRDTALILWSVVKKTGSTGTQTTNYCNVAGYSCVSNILCSTENVKEDLYCAGTNVVCCTENPIKKCTSIGGQVCNTGLVCNGTETVAKDVEKCCIGNCIKETITSTTNTTKSECEEEGYACMSSCGSNYAEVEYDCTGSKICCKRLASTTQTDDEIPVWVWAMIGVVILGVIIIVYIYRERIKMFLFKSKMKNNSNNNPQQGGNTPGSRPPFPPGARPPYPPRRPMYYPPRFYENMNGGNPAGVPR